MKYYLHILFLFSTTVLASINDANTSGIKMAIAEIKNRLLNMLHFETIDENKPENINYRILYANTQVPNDVIKKISRIVNRNEPIHDVLIRNYSDNDAALSYFWLMVETLFVVEAYNTNYRIRYNPDVIHSMVDYMILADKNFSLALYLKEIKNSEQGINDFLNSSFNSGIPVNLDELINRIGGEIVRLLTLLANSINIEVKLDEDQRLPKSFLSKSFQWQFVIHGNSADSNNDKLFTKLSSFDMFNYDLLSELSFRPKHIISKILSTGFTSNFKGPNNIIQDYTLNLKDVYDIFNMISNLKYKEMTPKSIISMMMSNVCHRYRGRFGILLSEYLELPKTAIQSLISEMHCVRGYLFTFGFPDSKGRLSFPYGWPRNIDYALADILSGQASGCGLCYALIGFLLAIGYPPVVTAYSGISITSSGSTVQVLPPLSHLKIPFDIPYNSFDFPEEKSGFDQPFISFVTGSKLGDSLCTLAHSYYLKSGFGHVSNVYMGLPKSSHYSLHRPADESPVKCLRAIPHILEIARNSINVSNGDNWLHPDINESYASTMLQSAHDMHNASRYYAEFIKSIASEGNPDGIRALGELYYMGHDDGEISRDIMEALRIWGDAAESGDPVSALAVASVHLQSGSNSLSSAEPFLQMVLNDPKSTKEQVYLAKFYMARHGLGREKNPYEAGEYLLKAGTFGDTMTQMLIGHAYAGILVGVKMHEGTNLYRALKHYKYAANAGSIVGKYNSAILTIQGYDPLYSTAYERCNAAYPLFHKVAMKNPSVTSLLHMAKRSEILNDQTGALLSYMMLSELGHPVGHVRSAKLWKYRKYDNYISKSLVKNLSMTLFSKFTGGLITNSVPLPQKEYYKPPVKYAILAENFNNSKNSSKKLHYQHLLKSEYLFCFARPVSHYQELIDGVITTRDNKCLKGNDGNELCLFYYSKRAAARNDPDAMSFIANSYLTTKNWINKDYSIAFKWANDAAKLGSGMGIYISARVLELGIGVDRNCEMALMYYKTLFESSQLESKIVSFIMILTTTINHFIYNLQRKIGIEIIKFPYKPCNPEFFSIKYRPFTSMFS